MLSKEIHFVGLLANVDSSITRVRLSHGFKIESLSESDGSELFAALETLPPIEVQKKLLMGYPCLNLDEKRYYFVGKSFQADTDSSSFDAVARFDNEFVHTYLADLFRLTRLFNEGNVCMPLTYYYALEDGSPRSFVRGATGRHISRESFTIDESEIANLHLFTESTKLPFQEKFLQLGFENFELSYQVQHPALSFLTLMMSLETLFNPGGQEIKYRVSRNVAVLLGIDSDESDKIFVDVKELYDKRSEVVHKGLPKAADQHDLLKLRSYVRESIKQINKLGRSKNELLALLNSSGFGMATTWRTEDQR